MPAVEVRRAVDADAERLAAVYRSAYAQNEELGFPAKAGSATAETVREWIEEHRLFAAAVKPDDEDGRRIVGGVRLTESDPGRTKLSRGRPRGLEG